MRTLSASELLVLWESGSTRHPLDRALLLFARARSDLPPAELADLPLGALNEDLIELRSASFGARMEVCIDCERCGERLELELNAGTFLATAAKSDARAELEVAGFRFRAPAMRDLAAVAHQCDPDAAALQLLERCCVARPAGAPIEPKRLLADVEDSLEAADPLADIGLAVSCEACGHSWTAAFDIASLLWDEIAARARALLGEIHVLARAYGWSESEILTLSAQRREAYLDMVSA